MTHLVQQLRKYCDEWEREKCDEPIALEETETEDM